MFKASLMLVMMQRRVLRNQGQRTLSLSLLQPRLLAWQVWQVWQRRQDLNAQVLP